MTQCFGTDSIFCSCRLLVLPAINHVQQLIMSFAGEFDVVNQQSGVFIRDAVIVAEPGEDPDIFGAFPELSA